MRRKHLSRKQSVTPKFSIKAETNENKLLKAEIKDLRNKLRIANLNLKQRDLKLAEKTLVFEETLDRVRKNSGIQAKKNRLLATAFMCLSRREEAKVLNQEFYDQYILDVLREFNADWRELYDESKPLSEKIDREKIRAILKPYFREDGVSLETKAS